MRNSEFIIQNRGIEDTHGTLMVFLSNVSLLLSIKSFELTGMMSINSSYNQRLVGHIETSFRDTNFLG